MKPDDKELNSFILRHKHAFYHAAKKYYHHNFHLDLEPQCIKGSKNTVIIILQNLDNPFMQLPYIQEINVKEKKVGRVCPEMMHSEEFIITNLVYLIFSKKAGQSYSPIQLNLADQSLITSDFTFKVKTNSLTLLKAYIQNQNISVWQLESLFLQERDKYQVMITPKNAKTINFPKI